MTNQKTTTEPTITDIRRTLLAEADDFHQRRQPYRKMTNQAEADAYDALVTASCYSETLAAILRHLVDHGHEDLADIYAGWISDVMNDGEAAGMSELNDDLTDAGPAS